MPPIEAPGQSEVCVALCDVCTCRSHARRLRYLTEPVCCCCCSHAVRWCSVPRGKLKVYRAVRAACGVVVWRDARRRSVILVAVVLDSSFVRGGGTLLAEC